MCLWVLLACALAACALPAPGPPTPQSGPAPAALPTPAAPAPEPGPAPAALPSADKINLDPATQTAIARAKRAIFLIPFSHWDTDWHRDFSVYAAQADRN